MKIVRCKLWVGRYELFTIFGVIFCKDWYRPTKTDINHEAIHWEQQKWLLVVGFILLYAIFFLVEIARCAIDIKRGKSDVGYTRTLWQRAYHSIPFEREAYANEKDQLYIYNRKRYGWLKYFS